MSHRFAVFLGLVPVLTAVFYMAPPGNTTVVSDFRSGETRSTETSLLTVTFRNRCDGSAAASVAGKFLVTASDEVDDKTEENTLALYDPVRGGQPVATFPLNDILGLPKNGKKSKKEADLEAATAWNGRVYWIASHSLSKDGEERPARYQFFATKVAADGRTLQISGKPYHLLKRDILAAPTLAPLLGIAATRTPEESGGWNIEGMTATSDGRILIAFRNPVVDGRYALLAPMLNPEAVIGGQEVARFGAPIQLDLSGGNRQAGMELGIRDIAWWPERKRYVILAGSYLPGDTAKVPYRILLWDGKSSPTPINLPVDFSELNAPEAVFLQPGNKKRILVLSDDGSRNGCKSKPDDERDFRGKWVDIP